MISRHCPHQKSVICLIAVIVLTITGVIPVKALEQSADYPPLPTGYTSIKVFDNQGRVAGRILPDKRYWVPIDRIPEFLQKALVAVEDARFYDHKGIDIRGIARALVTDVVKGKLVEGGSTITQQLIKVKFFSGVKTIDRKVKEALMAMEYEQKYTKKEILEMYFNEIYYGNGAWGIAQASLLYFDKKPEDLTNAECVLLAGVPKAPTNYNPLGTPEKVMNRRNLVLKRMVDLNMITLKQQKKLRINPRVVQRTQASYYLTHIRNKLIEKYGPSIIESGGLEVTTAMDLNLQKLAEKAVQEGVKRISPELQGALICMDASTGDVLAAVGGVDSTKSPYNRAFSARRQPGSAIKPLIYAAAIEKGITPASIWNDKVVAYKRSSKEAWKPQNYEGKSYGDLSLRKALAYSNNVITIKLLESIGIPYFTAFASKMGLSLRNRGYLSLALGTEEVSLSELVQAYTPLANGGLRTEARTIIRISDRKRRTLMENPPVIVPAFSPAIAYVTTRMLEDVMIYGTAKNLKKFNKTYPAAGKTGTTNDYRDAWFIGYTPKFVTGVWVGHDQPKPGGKGFTGGAICAPIWERFMRSALTNRPINDFQKPETVIALTIDPSTGYLATPECPDKNEEFFVIGTEPKEYCPLHGGDLLNQEF